MKKKVNGHETRRDKAIKMIVMFMLILASLMPLTVSAGTQTATNATASPTPTPAPTIQLPHSAPPPINQQSTDPTVSWNS